MFYWTSFGLFFGSEEQQKDTTPKPILKPVLNNFPPISTTTQTPPFQKVKNSPHPPNNTNNVLWTKFLVSPCCDGFVHPHPILLTRLGSSPPHRYSFTKTTHLDHNPDQILSATLQLPIFLLSPQGWRNEGIRNPFLHLNRGCKRGRRSL